jgi:uncharacterized surface protein with fasciclin (FAS1) repeats
MNNLNKIFCGGCHLLLSLLILLAGLNLFSACDSDNIDEGALYTFTDKTMGQYLLEDEQYSEFCRLLDTTKVMGLLKAYGYYTCFAPTNEAMQRFYQLFKKTDLSQFAMDSLKRTAYDHIIDGWVVKTSDFNEGRLGQLSMSGRYISISYVDPDSIFVNDSSYISIENTTVHNGVIHTINSVLNPTRYGISEVIAKDTNFTLFNEALILTGMVDSLQKVEDVSYDPDLYDDLIGTSQESAISSGAWSYDAVPQSRKYGYTVFMESDKTYGNTYQINNIEDLKKYAATVYDELYPDDAMYYSFPENRRNSLNRFVSYHLINKELSYSRLIDAYDTEHQIKTINMYEYLEPMLDGSLIEISKVRSLGNKKYINRFYSSDAGIRINSAYYDKGALNGVYHEIDAMLVYTSEIEAALSSKRLRFDAASFFPELTNNNLRGSLKNSYVSPNAHYKLPYKYIDRIECSEQTTVGYLLPYYKYQDYEGDEIFLNATGGDLYDFTITTPCVPAGTYEVRFGYLTNGKRGVAQLYFDGDPCGVPLNLNNEGSNTGIGWVEPGSNESDADGFLNDKMMRNRGYMKAPACFKVPEEGWSYGEDARHCVKALRKILGTYTFKTAGTHLMAVRGLSSGEFMFDYLEFVPTSVLESEDIY